MHELETLPLYLCLNVAPKWENHLISFEGLIKGVLWSCKSKNSCEVCRTHVGCEAGSDLLMILLLLLREVNLSQDSCSSALFVPAQEGSLPLVLLDSPVLGWLLVFKPFSWQMCQGRWEFWPSWWYQKHAIFSFCSFLFVLLSPLMFAKLLWFIAHKKIHESSCIHPEQWMAVFCVFGSVLGTA